MPGFIDSLMNFPFLQNAFLGGLFSSIIAALIGPFIVIRKISYIAGGIAHSVFAGLAIANWAGYDPLWGALVMAIFSGLLIATISIKHKEKEDTIISALWAGGMAIGVIFIAKTPGYATDLMSYMFGNILIVRDQDLILLAGLSFITLITVMWAYQKICAVSFDSEFVLLRGVSVNFYNYLLYLLVSLAVVVLIQIVGLILVIALLTLPAAIACRHFFSLKKIMLLTFFLALVFTSSGIMLGYYFDLPASAPIILMSTLVYMFDQFFVRKLA
ncbi:MAG: metal ABC transporter permease [Oligoflexales bacterium]|nr:metal ABC transporter permease [Oligoflexales bacterium]